MVRVTASDIASVLEITKEKIGPGEMELFYVILERELDIFGLKQLANSAPFAMEDLMTAYIKCGGSTSETTKLLESKLLQNVGVQFARMHLHNHNQAAQFPGFNNQINGQQSQGRNFDLPPTQNQNNVALRAEYLQPNTVTPTYDQSYTESRAFSFSKEDHHCQSSASQTIRPSLVPTTPNTANIDVPVERIGRWTLEEETYAKRLILEFSNGVLPLKDGITLCHFLSQMLNCKRNRVTKKFRQTYKLGTKYTRNAKAIERMPTNEIKSMRADLSE